MEISTLIRFLIFGFMVQTGLSVIIDEGLRTPCKARRTEIAFPRTQDMSGKVRYPDKLTHEDQTPGLLHVTLKWRRQKLEIILYKNQVTSQETHSEWTEGNITYSMTSHRDCYYHGYIKKQSLSYVAISTCSGLSGYLQTNEELLYIKPSPMQSKKTQQQINPSSVTAHIIYTCEGRSKAVPHPEDNKSTARHIGRRRRSRKRPRWLEVMVAVDHTVVAEVGSKERTQDYVMVLMNIANTVYQHHSLDVDIKVVVVKIVFLDNRQQRQVLTRNDAYRTVNQFCTWSTYQIPVGQQPFYDVSVLITKERLGPSGYAPITGLCNPIRSCAAVREEGFSTGFIIAHEMAHVFGVFHDGHGNTCYGAQYRNAMMAALVESKLNHFYWSHCSKRRMKEMVRYLHCLNNEPKILVEDHYSLKAQTEFKPELGRPYSLDFQCRMEFGSYFRLCGAFYSDPCSALWCSTASSPFMCRTKRGPPMPGTSCGRDRECRNEVCQYVGNMRPVNGNWGTWAAWSDCSSGCGVGIRTRDRVCNNPAPAYDGKDCDGKTSEWGTCVNKTCETITDPRAGECIMWDTLQIRYGTHKWQPYEGQNASSLCKQTCQSKYTKEAVTIDVDTNDGTPCTYTGNNSNICVHGNCLNVGCDGEINSTKREDRCGVCGGDSSSCKIVNGHFAKMPKAKDEYFPVITLPAGSRDILVEETNRSAHFLALNDPRYGTYGLGGDKRQSPAYSFVYVGAMFQYTRSSADNNESLSSEGPLMNDIIVMVYPNDEMMKTSIHFSYTVGKEDFTFEKNKFAWKFDKWSQCSVTCGKGIQNIEHKCIDKLTDEDADEENCKFIDAPRRDSVQCTREQCGLHNYNWRMLNTYGDCDAECGESGVQIQKYVCERAQISIGTFEKVALSYCSHLQPPEISRVCKSDPCDTSIKHQWFVSGDWPDCPCGETLTQTREVTCQMIITDKDKTGDKTEDVDDEKCSLLPDKPAASKYCKGNPCEETNTVEYEYNYAMANDWSDCDAECGETGHQDQLYYCERIHPESGVTRVDLSECSHIDPPKRTRECQGQPCEVPVQYKWKVAEFWSECPCVANSMTTRRVVCNAVTNETADGEEKEVSILADNDYCKDIPNKPDSSKPCKPRNCEKVYKYNFAMTNRYGECDGKCGKWGVQKQLYECKRRLPKQRTSELVEMENCSHLRSPRVRRKHCRSKPCKKVITYQWSALEDWSECPCGDDNTHTRAVKCQRTTKLEEEGSNTKDKVEDVSLDNCKNVPNKPDSEKPCKGVPCLVDKPIKPQYKYNYAMSDEWSKCDAPCGTSGQQKQEFYCERTHTSDGSVQRVDLSKCSHIDPPIKTKSCQSYPCEETVKYRYNFGMTNKFGECDAKCGKSGVQKQLYLCKRRHPLRRKAEFVDMEQCSHLRPPRVRRRRCRSETCKKSVKFQWSAANEWSVCPCGPDTTQTRVVTCQRITTDENASGTEDTKVTPAYEHKCDSLEKPETSRSCEGRPCDELLQYKWSATEEWGDCNAECGMAGTQPRLYTCQELRKGDDAHNKNVSDDRCDAEQRQNETRPCEGQPCPLQWSVGDWSECSVTCGRGKRYRTAHCGDPTTDKDDIRCSLDAPPSTSEACNIKICPEPRDEHCADKYSFCHVYRALNFRCKRSRFRRKCCKTCMALEAEKPVEEKKAAAAYRNKPQTSFFWR